jgi:hypothetical protein
MMNGGKLTLCSVVIIIGEKMLDFHEIERHDASPRDGMNEGCFTLIIRQMGLK